jgi:hypothetical protein
VQTASIPAGLGPIRDVELLNGWAFVAGGEFSTIDVTAAAPVRNAVNRAICGDQLSVAVSGGYAFVGLDTCGSGWISVYDVSNPASPRHLHDHSVSGVTGHYFTDLLMSGSDYLIGVSDAPTERDVMVFDRRDPGKLIKVAELSIPDATAFRGKILGSTLYVVGREGRIAAVDLSTPTSPRLIASAFTPGFAHGVDGTGTTVTVAGRGTGIGFFAASAGTINLTGSHVVGGDSWDVALAGSTLYVANDLGLIVVTDVIVATDKTQAWVTEAPSLAGGLAR